MSTTTFEGQAQNAGGNIEEIAGKATGDQSLQASGLADQIIGNAKQVGGAAKDALSGAGPLADKARAFAKDRPFATAALVGVVGLAVLNTLRGK